MLPSTPCKVDTICGISFLPLDLFATIQPNCSKVFHVNPPCNFIWRADSRLLSVVHSILSINPTSQPAPCTKELPVVDYGKYLDGNISNSASRRNGLNLRCQGFHQHSTYFSGHQMNLGGYSSCHCQTLFSNLNPLLISRPFNCWARPLSSSRSYHKFKHNHNAISVKPKDTSHAIVPHSTAHPACSYLLVFRELGLSPKFTGKFSQPSKTAKFTQGELGQICSKGVWGLGPELFHANLPVK